MSLVISRPPPTLELSNKHYTIHTRPNDIFSLKMPYMKRTTVVSFKKWNDALRIGQMIETHYVHKREWPDTRSETLSLPSSQLGDNDLEHIYIQMWNFEELKVLCTKNILDVILIENVFSKDESTFSLAGNIVTFEAPDDFYRLRFEELLTSSEGG